ncbi:hypothetical protein M902_1787 [Bacteriovorax sp. BAL6_X]|nr:hypothetical protein M902_1787 [Bacteriovorax sp. BAL6_X]
MAYTPTKSEVDKAKEIAVASAEWFEYTTGKMNTSKIGQCGDYALRFVLEFNRFVGKNVARLVVANNPIESGTYRVGEKVNVKKLGFNGFASGASGFLIWDNQLYLYHPIIGAYQIFLVKAWTPKKHFGVDMLDKRQVHVWASVGKISVDPTYYDLWPDRFSTPLGKDE